MSQDVIFVDRLSDGVMELAAKAKSNGSLIVYEPSSKHDRPWMHDMLGLTDVVKYAADREEALAVDLFEVNAGLIVRTDGARGASWRAGGRSGAWHHHPADRISGVVDTCGAGDWFTAGLLQALFDPVLPLGRHLETSAVARAIERASALAAWSCGFVGARGALYDATPLEFRRKVGLVGSHEARLARSSLQRPVLPEADCRSLSSICNA